MATAVTASLAATNRAAGQAVPITVDYTQTFNTLTQSGTASTWTNESTLAGWSAYTATSAGTATAITQITGSAGGVATAGLYSWGSNSSSDRALGSLIQDAFTGAGGSVYYVAHLTNNSGHALSSVSVTYNGEEWRVANATAQSLTVQTATVPTNFGAAPGSSGWSSDTAGLTFTTPVTSATASALDGNADANRTVGLHAVIPISVPIGQDFYVRWRDLNDSGTDSGMGVDQLHINTGASVMISSSATGFGASHGTITVTGSGGNYAPTVLTPATQDNFGFAQVSSIGNDGGDVFALLDLNGSAGDITNLITDLNANGGSAYRVLSAASTGADLTAYNNLNADYGGQFNAIVDFTTPGTAVGSFTWDFSATDPNVTVAQLTLVPEPTVLGGVLLLLGTATLRRKKQAV